MARSLAYDVLVQPDLRELIFAYQVGISCTLQHMLALYQAKLEQVQYRYHPDLSELVDPIRLRGYMLCRLIREGYCVEANELLDMFPGRSDLKLPSRLSPLLRWTVDSAAKHRDLALIKRLHARGLGAASVRVLEDCVQEGKKHKEVLAFLKAHRPNDARVRPPVYGEPKHIYRTVRGSTESQKHFADRLDGAPTSTVVFGQEDLLTRIFGFQAGLPKALSDVVRAYHETLGHVHYLDHPDLCESASPPLLRGYMLCRLVSEALLLRAFPHPIDIMLPLQLVPSTELHDLRVGRCATLAVDTAGDLAIHYTEKLHRKCTLWTTFCLCHLATDSCLFRGYVLCRLVHDARVTEALLLLRTFGQHREMKLLRLCRAI
ncbi:hypothetical protein SPRG_15711 [Saprolegnia parasitica CBS 223.65]|uniref:Uncharacterized protein n=1 Tax=Saprolegnia parasitica (strain CBS 223.65) TaxID=695850 RepID=A0A067BL10_SAPPC|nr:hypothetical protein SPRG_15711 [Saprolegnia parasitica CBS 223.65]KDO19144.1 hypothetical protein SPRG_15711 [Saprolegnia parasitica CBS 223.65]|eukprot:XP_012210142.1 hypothetical protein SPRG_15711 [Saprolegnia parasitica CBS 223.65]